MAARKTKPNGLDVVAVLNGIPDEQQRQDRFTIVDLMRNATMAEPRMWGSRIVGFGDTHSTYASGRSGAWFLVGFAPRKHNLTLYSSADGLDRRCSAAAAVRQACDRDGLPVDQVPGRCRHCYADRDRRAVWRTHTYGQQGGLPHSLAQRHLRSAASSLPRQSRISSGPPCSA